MHRVGHGGWGWGCELSRRAHGTTVDVKLPAQGVQYVCHVLHRLDANGDGTVSYPELLYALRAADVQRAAPAGGAPAASPPVLSRSMSAAAQPGERPLLPRIALQCPCSFDRCSISSTLLVRLIYPTLHVYARAGP